MRPTALVDAAVAATALEAGCTALVDNDRAFRTLGPLLVFLDDLVSVRVRLRPGSGRPRPPWASPPA
jgi:hypothetical protein